MTVSGLTAVSRVAGFVRDTLTAQFLGAGPVADAFFVAQRLPNLFRSLFAEGAFSAAFVPLYTAEHEKHGERAAQDFAGQALLLLLAALIPFSVIVMLAMPQIMLLLAPGFEHDSQKYASAVRFSTITFPYLALISVTALQTGILNARGRFGPGAAAPIAFNIVLIAGLFAARAFHWQTGLTLAWSVTVSGIVQCLWLAVSCWRARASIPLRWTRLGESSRRLFARIGPGAVGAGAAQINLLISQNLASGLPTGAISYLFYADRLNQLPLGIVGIAVATTLLPLLSRHVSAGNEAGARTSTGRAVEFCLLLGLPAMIGLGVMSRPIIQILFQHGAFGPDDTMQTVRALRMYVLGIPGFLLVKVFAACFFARHDTRTPVRIALIVMATNVALSFLLLRPLQHAGIALANSLAVTLNAGLLYLQLRRKGMRFGTPALAARVAKIIGSAAVMLGAGSAATWYVWTYAPLTSLPLATTLLAALITVTALSYAAALHVSGALKWHDVRTALTRNPQKII